MRGSEGRPDGVLNLDLALEIWARRKRLATAVFLVPFAAAIGLVIPLPNVYRSTATLLVERQQVPESFVKATVTSAVESRIQTITQEILSRRRLKELISRFGLDREARGEAGLDKIIERMRRDILVEPVGRAGTTVAVSITYRGEDPEKVADVANVLASFYVEQNSRVREEQAVETTKFLRGQLETVTQRLDTQEQRVSEFKKRHMGELPQQMEANLAILERLNSQLRLNSENQTRALQRRETMARLLSDGDIGAPSVAGAPTGPETTAARAIRLKRELAEMRTRFTDRHPDVIQLKGEIAALEHQLAETKQEKVLEEATSTPLADPALIRRRQAVAEAEAEIKVLKNEEKYLRDTLVSYQQRVENTPRREAEFQELSRDYQSTKEHYSTLLKRYEEAQLAESLEQRQKGEQFRIMDRAVASGTPAAPKRLLLIGAGFAIALGLSVSAIVIAERLDASFHDPEELQASTSVPVLVTIPRIVTEDDTPLKRRLLHLRVAWTTLAGATGGGVAYAVGSGRVPFIGGFVRSLLLNF